MKERNGDEVLEIDEEIEVEQEVMRVEEMAEI